MTTVVDKPAALPARMRAMARALRIEYPGAVYHVMARGSHGQTIFVDDQDRQRFVETLRKLARRPAGASTPTC